MFVDLPGGGNNIKNDFEIGVVLEVVEVGAVALVVDARNTLHNTINTGREKYVHGGG